MEEKEVIEAKQVMNEVNTKLEDAHSNILVAFNVDLDEEANYEESKYMDYNIKEKMDAIVALGKYRDKHKANKSKFAIKRKFQKVAFLVIQMCISTSS